MSPILIITGPTATGKTRFALTLARKFSGELVSADSRQVYIGADIVTGKDIPPGFVKAASDLLWQTRPLTYFTDTQTRIWLTDIVHPNEPFNVSFWKQCADLVIADIFSRRRLPIVVGGTGLYLKSLTQNLSQIHTPFNPRLRRRLAGYTAVELFNYLKSVSPAKAASLNSSDAANPRRLIRAIEIFSLPPPAYDVGPYASLTLGLTAPRDYLFHRVEDRVASRLQSGAAVEAASLLKKYSPDSPGMTACGYRAFTRPDFSSAWITSEKQYLRRQLTWFAKIPAVSWFDVSVPGWQATAEKKFASWYNQYSAQKTRTLI